MKLDSLIEKALENKETFSKVETFLMDQTTFDVINAYATIYLVRGEKVYRMNNDFFKIQIKK